MTDPMLNKFLTLRSGVIRTAVTDPVIARLEPYFAERNHHAIVESIFRDPDAQLRLIQKYCRQRNVKYTQVHWATVKSRIEFQGRDVYQWQPAWSALLSIGVIINPPLDAVCLMDYWRDGINKKGRMIPASPHQRGTEFDIGGRGGSDATVTDELAVVQEAMRRDPAIGIRSYTIERENNCLHISCGG